MTILGGYIADRRTDVDGTPMNEWIVRRPDGTAIGIIERSPGVLTLHDLGQISNEIEVLVQLDLQARVAAAAALATRPTIASVMADVIQLAAGVVAQPIQLHRMHAVYSRLHDVATFGGCDTSILPVWTLS